MASNNQELIDEVRALTGYESSNFFTDSDLEKIISIAKDELKTDLGLDNPDWYTKHDRTRALFWLTCIGVKIRAGEIGSVEFDIDEISSSSPDNEYSVWFTSFEKARRSAASDEDKLGPSSKSISRDNRSYSYDIP